MAFGYTRHGNTTGKRFAPGLKLMALCTVLLCSISAMAGINRDSSVTIATKSPDYYIDDDQRRIDLLDGAEDNFINTGDSANSAYAGRIYLTLIDSLQGFINGPYFDEARKKVFRENLYLQMRRVNARNFKSTRRFDNLFHFIQAELNGIKQHALLGVLRSNFSQSFATLSFFKAESCADTFLIEAARYYPDKVFKNYEIYYKQGYSQRVIEEAAKIAPVTVKRYFNNGEPIYAVLRNSNDTVVKIILQIMDRYTRKTNAFALLDDIVTGKTTMEKADAIGKNPEKYLHAMLSIRCKKNPLAVHSLEGELEIYALKFVRVLNDLHNEKDAVRFASIENFSADELYTLIVYSEEEIFTSSFNGLFNRMMVKLGPVSGFEFLERLGNNRFRTFIKMSAGFGKLSPFLQSMTAVHQQILMIKFASGLEEYNDLSQAVEVADAFGSVTDTLVLKILRSTIKVEYIKQLTRHNNRGVAIYGLLNNLFVDHNIRSTDWFANISKQYALPDFTTIANTKLMDRDGTNRWLIYFYDDEDGEASFSTFLKSFTDPNWRIIDSAMYVVIESKTGKAVDIYANKPKYEADGQERLEKIFADNEYEPNVMVHRGHSYYAAKTIEKVKDNTQIFVLGSCGGYHSISTIIERSGEASIVSSKQIGTMFVNNPMLKLVANTIREGQDVQWPVIWDKLGESVKNNAKAYERFLDYIPPHKNLGAIFIKTYNRIIETQL